MRLFFFLFIVFSIPLNVLSSTGIVVKNPDYAGKKLDFYRFADPVSREKVLAFSLHLDDDGQGAVNLETRQIQFVFSEFGIYRGMLVVEPGATHELKLPPLREKSFADEKNPYFEPVEFWIETSDKNQFSTQLSAFTIRLNQLTGKYFDRLYFRQSKTVYDSILYFLDREFPAPQSGIFQLHKKFTLKMIKAEAFREKPESYATMFSSVNPEFITFPAYINLFEKTFSNALGYAAKNVKGEELKTAINRSDADFLLKFVNEKYGLSGEDARLVLLKCLHDAWYSGEFSKPAIEKMIRSGVFTKSSFEPVRSAASNIDKKISFLRKGTTAPVICLENLQGKNYCSDHQTEKLKYIVFADVEMVVCGEHLKYLTRIEELFGKKLEIIVVLRETDPAGIKNFFSENKIPGIKLVDENNKFIENYRVKSFPACFLLDEKHRVVLAPAKSPLDGFEQQFAALMQQRSIEQLRNQSR